MPEIVLTKDNSPTLFSENFLAHYHSIHGALQESMHVFIENGLKYYISHSSVQNINVLEVGLGTGMNCYLCFQEVKNNFPDKIIEYIAVEKYPLEKNIIDELSDFSVFSEDKEIFFKVHSSQDITYLNNHFTLKKFIADVNDELMNLSDESIDIVFYDAFAPSSQPELWTKEIFQKLYNILKPNSILVTYCAKGEFKRTLKSIGFKVENPPGAAGKREMTRAIKI